MLIGLEARRPIQLNLVATNGVGPRNKSRDFTNWRGPNLSVTERGRESYTLFASSSREQSDPQFNSEHPLEGEIPPASNRLAGSVIRSFSLEIKLEFQLNFCWLACLQLARPST